MILGPHSYDLLDIVGDPNTDFSLSSYLFDNDHCLLSPVELLFNEV